MIVHRGIDRRGERQFRFFLFGDVCGLEAVLTLKFLLPTVIIHMVSRRNAARSGCAAKFERDSRE